VSKLAIFAFHQNQTGTEIWGATVMKASQTNEKHFEKMLV
jgi:hypothetical protein